MSIFDVILGVWAYDTIKKQFTELKKTADKKSSEGMRLIDERWDKYVKDLEDEERRFKG